MEKLIKICSILYMTEDELAALKALNDAEDVYKYFIKLSKKLNERCGCEHPPKYYMFAYGYSYGRHWWQGR